MQSICGFITPHSTVRSYGTEDRDAQFPIAPQNLVYDYILFRGSDIKDIRVVNNVATIPQDPAIMQMQMHPGQGNGSLMGPGPVGGLGGGVGYPGQQPFQPQGGMPMGGMGGVMPGLVGGMGGYNAMGGLGGPLGPGGMGGIAPGANMSGLHKTKQTSELMSVNGGSGVAGGVLADVVSMSGMIGGGDGVVGDGVVGGVVGGNDGIFSVGAGFGVDPNVALQPLQQLLIGPNGTVGHNSILGQHHQQQHHHLLAQFNQQQQMMQHQQHMLTVASMNPLYPASEHKDQGVNVVTTIISSRSS